MPVVELFAHQSLTTVPAGADAPAAGTVEAWTVASSASFPVAVTGASQFHVVDPAAPSEVVLVTSVSGTTWTVTRGADGTTPVAHAAGFQVFADLTAGILGQLQQVPWNAQWRAAKLSALAGTGTAKAVIIGDSWAAGQSTGTITDCLLYGWAGRLDNMLATLLGGYAEGYAVASVANFTPSGLTSPSAPYSQVATSSYTPGDGGIGQVWAPGGTGSTWLTISAPVHPVTGVNPVSMDILTIDFNAVPWQYKVDGGSATVITPSSGSPPSGVSGSVGNGIVRRTSITFSGNTTHSVAIQANSGSNALVLIGHVTYYSTVPAGFGMFRNGVPGWKATDFATGGGGTASSTGSNSLTPDHIIPWSGVGPTQPATPPSMTSSAVNVNIYAASSPSAFPFNADLAIIALGGNDCTQGGSIEAMRRALVRFVNAFRRGSPASSAAPGASVLLVAEAYASPYSDNATAASPTNTVWQEYKQVIHGLAQQYGCGYLDLQQVMGEDPVERGLMAIGGAHPTQNGGGYNSGDGHLAIANAIFAML